MNTIPKLCLLIDDGSPYAAITRSALTALFDRLLIACSPDAAGYLAFDPLDDDGWTRLSAGILADHGSVDAIIFCAPPADRGDEAVMTAQWLAMREMLRLLPPGQQGIFVSQHHAPLPDQPERAAALQAARMGMDAAIIDGVGMDRRPRANRLVIAPRADPAAIGAAMAFLCDPRSGFMTGAELALDATPTSGSPALAGKTILITGATSGLGRASAIEAARLGAFVAVGGRKPDPANETLALLRAAGGDGMVVPLDVTDPAGWQTGIASIVAARGALHGLVNNAGESRNRRLDQLTGADLDFLLSINYRGTLLGMAAAEAAIIGSGGGSIVNISSVAGIRGGPGAAAYSATKAAIIGYSLARAASLRDLMPRLRVNALQPGLIWSDSVADSLGEAGAQAFRARIEPQTPLGRVTTPEEVALPVCYLLSDAAAPVTGQAIHVSGGLEINFP